MAAFGLGFWRRWIPVTLGAVVLVQATLLWSLSRPLSARAAEWGASVSALPVEQAVAEAHRLPIAYRKAMVAISSPVRRVRLWRAHMDAYVAQTPSLSDAQRTVIAQLDTVLSDNNADKSLSSVEGPRLRGEMTEL